MYHSPEERVRCSAYRRRRAAGARRWGDYGQRFELQMTAIPIALFLLFPKLELWHDVPIAAFDVIFVLAVGDPLRASMYWTPPLKSWDFPVHPVNQHEAPSAQSLAANTGIELSNAQKAGFLWFLVLLALQAAAPYTMTLEDRIRRSTGRRLPDRDSALNRGPQDSQQSHCLRIADGDGGDEARK
ncbi:hypothetical protein NLJ89_g7502 [Agrocybe chaxingu]|uniref:Uncharacterized protein n=1 Tax=Agrocybe chaxingu TaxID=84603 RepID=A0A9W8JUG4_9AGAR|nr:hypothetical protein NLJ89_g7502 [Agrocybe chaxingu]